MTKEEQFILYLKFAKLVAKVGLPKNIGEHEVFQEFMTYIGFPQFKPTLRTATKYISPLGESYLAEMKERIQNLKLFCPKLVSAMADVWKSPQDKHYMGHFGPC